MAINVSGFNVPATPTTENQGLTELDRMMTQNRRWQYMLMKDKEMQDWRKANLVNELTDPSKYKTGSDVADGITNSLMTNVAQKYLSSAKAMNPLELEAGVKRDTSGVIAGANGIRDELNAADKHMELLKQAYPNLDTSKILYDIVRPDIVHRHLNESGDDFDSPINVANKKPAIDLTDPNELSKYVKGTENLNKYFSSPQGLDKVDAYTGNRENYNRFTAKGIPSWRQTNYDPNQLSEGLFLPKNVSKPSMGFRTQTLPIEALPSSQGKPFEMMAEQPFNLISGKEKLELMNATRQWINSNNKGVDYDKMEPEEQELAQRKVALDVAKQQDKSDFYLSDIHTPSAAKEKLWMGETSGGKTQADEAQIRNVYKEITDKADTHAGGLVPMVDLSAGAQAIALKQARDLTGEKDLSQGDIYLIKHPDGKLMISRVTTPKQPKATDPIIGEMDFAGTNLGVQAGVKGRTAVVAEGNKQSKATTRPPLDSFIKQ